MKIKSLYVLFALMLVACQSPSRQIAGEYFWANSNMNNSSSLVKVEILENKKNTIDIIFHYKIDKNQEITPNMITAKHYIYNVSVEDEGLEGVKILSKAAHIQGVVKVDRIKLVHSNTQFVGVRKK